MVYMIKKSTYYSVVREMTEASTIMAAARGVIVFKGSKKSCVSMKKKLAKSNPGFYYIAITSKPIGEFFVRHV